MLREDPERLRNLWRGHCVTATPPARRVPRPDQQHPACSPTRTMTAHGGTAKLWGSTRPLRREASRPGPRGSGQSGWHPLGDGRHGSGSAAVRSNVGPAGARMEGAEGLRKGPTRAHGLLSGRFPSAGTFYLVVSRWPKNPRR
jgi:hypothetical protein